MKIVDLHIHSKYSLATSKDMTIENIAYFSNIKGITHIATGDLFHSGWLNEIEKKLIPEENGFFKLKNSKSNSHFILSGEVSLIFGKKGNKKKVHILIVSSNLKEVKLLKKALSHYGNLESNGRPFLKLSLKELSRIISEETGNTYLIPAHIWTPHYSIFGSKSGFNSLEEAFEGDVSNKIIAMETGLSSDPPMNWLVKDVMRYNLVSNSDSHSPFKIGRELNVFYDFETFGQLISSIKTGKGFLYTVEYFPEEGKYHYDGHRNCGVSFHPEETRKNNGICPVCKRKLTVGVLNRVYQLSDIHGKYEGKKIPFKHSIPLIEIIAKALGKPESTKMVKNFYFKMIEKFGNEFKILFEVELEELSKNGFSKIALFIEMLREEKLNVIPGYDGVYGKIEFLTEDKNEL